MNTKDAKELLAAATKKRDCGHDFYDGACQSCMAFWVIAGEAEKARRRIEETRYATLAVAIKLAAALKRAQNMPLLMKTWEKASRDNAYDTIQEALAAWEAL